MKKNKKRVYLAGIGSLAVSESLYDFAFAVMAFHYTGQALVGALVYALGYSAEIIGGLFLGGFLDRLNKAKLFSWTIALKMLVFTIVIIYFSQYKSLAIILIAAFSIDMLNHVSRLADDVLLFNLFEDKQQRNEVVGNSIVLNNLIRIAGPAVAGMLLLVVAAPTWLLAISVVFQIFALVAYRYCSNLVKAPQLQPTANTEVQTPLWHASFDASRALKHVLSSRIGALALAETLFVGIYAVIVLLMFPLFSYQHQIADKDIGLLMSCGVIGTIMVGLVFNKILARIDYLRAILWGAALISLFTAMLTLNGQFIYLALLLPLLYASATIFFRSYSLFIRENVPQDKIGSYWSGMDSFGRIFSLITILIGGYMFDRMGGASFYQACSVILFVCTLVLARQLYTLRQYIATGKPLLSED